MPESVLHCLPTVLTKSRELVYWSKGSLNSEDTGDFLGGKFKFSDQDSDLEYLSWQCKNPPASSDLKPTLTTTFFSKIHTHRGK